MEQKLKELEGVQELSRQRVDVVKKKMERILKEQT